MASKRQVDCVVLDIHLGIHRVPEQRLIGSNNLEVFDLDGVSTFVVGMLVLFGANFRLFVTVTVVDNRVTVQDVD